MRTTRARHGRIGLVAAGVAAIALALTGCGSGDDAAGDVTEITWLTPAGPTNVENAERLVEAFQAEHPEIRVSIVTRPEGTEGDNLIRTRLATETMEDVFDYNSGSLLMALNPEQTMVDLSDADWMSYVSEEFQSVVGTENGVFGAPAGATAGGGILYNIAIYEELGLEVPTTWDEFMANNAVIAEQMPEVAPVLQAYGDAWTSQILVLADFANVLSQEPDWADRFTANQATFTESPALDGFLRIQQIAEAGLLNRDFASMRLDAALLALATGAGAHFPALTFTVDAIAQNAGDDLDNVGFFAIPTMDGSEARATIWHPNGRYIPATTVGAEREAASTFLGWLTTSEVACSIAQETAIPTGPYVSSACEMPADVPRMISDLKTYVEAGLTAPALEFLSPVKGPNLERILVEVGTGIRSATDAAAMYDEDVRNQALQLNLPGW